MKPRLHVPLDKAEAVALRKLAQGADARLALRARIVLSRAGGTALRETAARCGVALATVQRWTDRFRAEGARGLVDPPQRQRRPHDPASAGLPPAGMPDALADGPPPAPPPRLRQHPRWLSDEFPKPERERGASGPPPRVQERIAAFIRDHAFHGTLAAGSELPPRVWFAAKFGTTPATAQKAFERLAADGWLREGSGRATHLADPLPFSGRFLFVRQYLEYGEGALGLDRSLDEARRRLETSRGIRVEVVGPEPGARGDALRDEIRAAVSARQYAGVFLRAASAGGTLPFDFLARMDGIPVGGFFERGSTDLGSHVTRFADARLADRDPYILLRTLLSDCRAAGARRVSVLDYRIDPRRERDGPRLAERYGLSLHPLHHLRLSLSDFLWNRKVLEMVFRMRDPQPPEAFIACNDILATMLCDFLVRHFGHERAQGIPVIAAGNRPLLPKTPLPVIWHGLDCEATLGAFLDWAEASRVSGPRPPDPERVYF